jgi:hypothetical protein
LGLVDLDLVGYGRHAVSVSHSLQISGRKPRLVRP